MTGLTFGGPLILEDLKITMNRVVFEDPAMKGMEKYKGKVSRRRWNKIIRMRRKRHPLLLWKDLL